MAIRFQYNKTSLQEMDKQLKMRVRALPTIKNKESALRMEVKRAKTRAAELGKIFDQKLKDYDKIVSLWGEFDKDLVSINDVKLSIKKLAGVRTPVLDEIDFNIKKFSLFNKPSWFLDGVKIIQELAEIAIEQDVFVRKMNMLDHARKKTTQKVNLYEKVQIPGYEEAIRKIKRFMEDEENLSKSAQKVIKTRQQNTEAA